MARGASIPILRGNPSAGRLAGGEPLFPLPSRGLSGASKDIDAIGAA